jgi:hypothetical protein
MIFLKLTIQIKKAMFNYTRFDFINQTKKSKVLKIFLNVIIIISILIVLLLNINTKDDVKIISTNSRRIINTLNNYTETMSDFMVSNLDEANKDNRNDELNELKNIRLSIDYFKEIKEAELKEQKEKKDIQMKQEKLKLQQEENEKKERKKEKAMQLIKSYIPNYDNLINLKSSHLEANGYSNDFNCLKRIIKINNEKLFNNLINIDYEKSEVSFNYLDKNEDYYKNTDNIIKTHLYSDYDENNNYYDYSHYIYRNYKENIIKNPIYEIIKNNLEINYTYTEPNLTEEYNNKSKYFQKSLNEFTDTLNDYKSFQYPYTKDKYYENYYNDTYYLYYKYIYNGKDNQGNIVNSDYRYVEFLIENKIIINNSNPDQIYNKHPYKFMCNIPSRTMNNKPTINNYYSFGKSYFSNSCSGGYPSSCNTMSNRMKDYNGEYNIEKILNSIYDINYYNDPYFKNNYIILRDYYDYYHSYSSNINYELDRTKGTRMINHNLTNNIPEYFNKYLDRLIIENHYFIEKVFIDFPIISIYDEYDYIKLLISGMADIYNLPIIPPIKFI